MDHPIEHIIDIIIAMLVFFLFPVLFFGLKQDAIVQTLVETETNEFVEDIRSKGYINKEMYEEYLGKLSVTNLLYDISLEHSHYSYEPEYRFRTEEEIIEEQNNSYTGENYYTYRPVHTDIPNVEDPIDNSGSLNTETNEGILAEAVRTPPSPTHEHSDDCYQGTKHTHSGYGGSCYSSYIPRCNSDWYYNGESLEWTDVSYCNICGRTDTLYTYWYRVEWICGRGEHYTYGYYSDMSCINCGDFWNTYTPSPWPAYCDEQLGDAEYTFDCDKSEGTYYDADGNEALSICSQIISSIEPTNPNQTVYINDPLITTINVTYMDGSKYILLASASFSTAVPIQNKIVVLSYTNIVGSASTTHNCNITVNVIPRNKTCSHGHTYNLNSDGSDPNCPFCRAYLSKLEVVIPSNGLVEIYKGTTLPSNGVTLLATYMDGRTEYLYSEYVDNLDTNYVGTQTVTISYKGKYASLTVKTKRNLTRCSVCNLYYELYPDGTDPGCPYCAARTPVFTGNILEYENHMYEADILRKLYEENGVYKFSIDDYIQVKITNKTKSLGNGILGAIIKGINTDFIHVIKGGYIREEK